MGSAGDGTRCASSPGLWAHGRQSSLAPWQRPTVADVASLAGFHSLNKARDYKLSTGSPRSSAEAAVSLRHLLQEDYKGVCKQTYNSLYTT